MHTFFPIFSLLVFSLRFHSSVPYVYYFPLTVVGINQKGMDKLQVP